MLKNYLKTALRALGRQKLYSGLNIAGLSVGMALGILAILYVQYEYSYDDFHPGSDQIYRLTLNGKSSALKRPIEETSFALAQELEENFPEVIRSTRIGRWNPAKFTDRNGTKIEERYYLYADANIFEMFDIRLIKGNPETALRDPYSIVLTEEMAQKYFGKEDPIGKTVEIGIWVAFASDWGGEHPNPHAPEGNYTVTGIARKMPGNSHLVFDSLLSMSTLHFWESWGANTYGIWNMFTYVMLEPDSSPGDLESKMVPMARTQMAQHVEKDLGLSYEEFEATGNFYEYRLQALSDIRLAPSVLGWMVRRFTHGSVKDLFFISLIALVVLLISIVNFVNLATARSAARAREVGIRKVFGASRRQLSNQFLIEPILLSSLALILGLALALVLLPVFNDLIETNIPSDFFLYGWVLPTMIGLSLLVGLLGGIYPALYLASYNPAMVLKGAISRGGKGISVRNTLVVSQFGIAIALIVVTLVVKNQLSYMRNAELGFDKENLVVMHGVRPIWPQIEADPATYVRFKEDLLAHSGVVSASGGRSFLGRFVREGKGGQVLWPAGAKPEEGVEGQWGTVDADVIKTLGMHLIDGDLGDHSILAMEKDWPPSGFILNETAVRKLGLTDHPIGTMLGIDRSYGPGELPVIGVVRDFHSNTLHTPIPPLYLHYFPTGYSRSVHEFYIRITGDGVPATLAHLKSVYKKYLPAQEFNYSFVDEDLDRSYGREERLGRIFGYFSILAIVIACLGIFGLAAFMAQNRIKEIGIRKVLGATAAGIVLLLAKDFLRLVAIAFLIATPLVYFALARWLEDFAFRTDIGVGVLVVAGFGTLMIAMITVSFQAAKASRCNPVDSIRYQ